MEITREQVNNVWKELIEDKNIIYNQNNPQGFVLGGQPGAGKSQLIQKIRHRLNKNVIVINGDDFRKFHPDYEALQEKYAKDTPKHTAEFASKMTEAILDKAVKEKYNVIIEGTFRTAQTPLNTLKLFKINGYKTFVMIQTCPKEISWQSCLERYKKMFEVCPKEARYTDKAHHDLVINKLALNVDIVHKSGLVDCLEIYSQEKQIFDSKSNQIFRPSIIDKELNRFNDINKSISL